MSDLTATLNAVEANSNVEDSVVTLLDRITSDVEAAKNDPVVIQDIVDDVRAERENLATAVAANTPVERDETETAPATAGEGTTTTKNF